MDVMIFGGFFISTLGFLESVSVTSKESAWFQLSFCIACSESFTGLHTQECQEPGLLKALSWRSLPFGRLTDRILKYYNHHMHPAQQRNEGELLMLLLYNGERASFTFHIRQTLRSQGLRKAAVTVCVSTVHRSGDGLP